MDECAVGRRYVEREEVTALCSVAKCVCVCVGRKEGEGIKSHNVMLFLLDVSC